MNTSLQLSAVEMERLLSRAHQVRAEHLRLSFARLWSTTPISEPNVTFTTSSRASIRNHADPARTDDRRTKMSRENGKHNLALISWSNRLLVSSALVLGIAVSIQTVVADELQEPRGAIGLPAIESLDFESDYTVFFGAKVPVEIRRRALRKLWASPGFNQTDSLDTYTGDYSRPGDRHRHGNIQLSLE